MSQRALVIPYRQPETSVRNYHHLLGNNTEERCSHKLRGGNLIYLIISRLKSSNNKAFKKNCLYIKVNTQLLHYKDEPINYVYDNNRRLLCASWRTHKCILAVEISKRDGTKINVVFFTVK
jgi:hypothetical protein